MKIMFKEYMIFALAIVCTIISLTIFKGIISNENLGDNLVFTNDQKETVIITDYDPPKISEDLFIVKNEIVKQGDTSFDIKDYYSASATNGMDLTDYITIDGSVDVNVLGKQTVEFTLTFNGEMISKTGEYYIVE